MNSELKKLIITSILVAIAVVLELITAPLLGWLSMPFGGSFVGISMVPLVLIGFVAGLKYGLAGGFVYGIVEILLAPSGNIVGLSFLLDYLFGFTAFGLTGLFYGKLNNYRSVIFGILLAGFVRYLSVSLAGVIFWAEYAEGNVFFYSFITYNLGYNVTTTLISLVVTLLISERTDIIAQHYLQKS